MHIFLYQQNYGWGATYWWGISYHTSKKCNDSYSHNLCPKWVSLLRLLSLYRYPCLFICLFKIVFHEHILFFSDSTGSPDGITISNASASQSSNHEVVSVEPSITVTASSGADEGPRESMLWWWQNIAITTARVRIPNVYAV